MPRIDKHVPGTPVWVDLMSSDPNGSRDFYGKLFDWSFDVGPPESGPYITCRKGDAKVCGIGPKPPGPMPTVWTTYLGVDDVDAVVAKIKAAGGGVFMGPMDVFEEGRLAVTSDPTGAVFGLWQSKKHRGFDVKNEPGTFAYAEVYTRDLARASAFYQQVFGYTARNLDGAPYQTFHLGAKEEIVVGGAMQMDDQFPKEVPAHWNVYLAVADTDACVARIKELGGKVIVPPFDTPYGRIAVVQDPQGGSWSPIQLSAKALAM